MRRPELELAGDPGAASPATVLVIGALLWVLAILQSALVARLPVPLGATPLVLVAVLGLGYALGPVPGALLGAWAGLGMDLVPPAGGPVGSWALILALVGLGIGHVRESRAPGPWLAIGLLAIGTLVAVGMRAAVLWFSGTTPALVPTVQAGAWAALTAIVVAPLALTAGQALTGRRRVRAARLPLPLDGQQ